MMTPCALALALSAAIPDGSLGMLGDDRFRPAGVVDFAFSPDGNTVALVGYRDGPCLYDLRTGRPIDPPGAQWTGRGTGVRFQDGGREIALLGVSFFDSDAHTYETASGRKLREHHVSPPKALSADGRLAVTAPIRLGFSGPEHNLIDLRSGEVIDESVNHFGMAEVYAFSPTDHRLAAGDEDGNLRIIDGRTGAVTRIAGYDRRPDPDGPPGVMAIAWSADGGRLAWTCFDGALRVWSGDADLHRVIWDGNVPLGGLAFSPDGGRIAFDDTAGRLRVIDSRSGRLLMCRRIGDPVWSPLARLTLYRRPVRFSPDGRFLGVAVKGCLRLFDAGDGRELTDPPGHTGSVDFLTFSPDGDRLVSRCDSGVLRVWDVATRRPVMQRDRRWRTDVSPGGEFLIEPDGDGDSVLMRLRGGGRRRLGPAPDGGSYGHRFSADGRLVAAGATYGDAAVWDVATGDEVTRGEFSWHRQLTGLHREADGRSTGLLVHREFPWAVHLRDLRDGSRLASLTVIDRPDWAVRSPDGRLVAVSVGGSSFRFWRPEDGRQWRAGREVHGLVFSPDASTVAGCDRDGHIILIEVDSGREVKRFHSLGGVRSLAFSPDGRTLAAGMADTTIRLWDVATGSAEGTPDQLWDRLAGDPGTAQAAIWALVDRPAEAVAVIRDRLEPEPPIDGDRVSSLIADLGSARFAARESAQRELTALGVRAIPLIEAALDDPRTSAEAKRRLGAVLRVVNNSPASPWQLKARRAVAVLERIDSPAGRGLLQQLADGRLGGWAATEANAALSRSNFRGGKESP